MMFLTLLTATVLAAPITPNEKLEWSVQWMGMTAGVAWSTLKKDGDGYRIDAGCESRGMAASMYPVDDVLTSWWSPETGSSSYYTKFREGSFQQDQQMTFLPNRFSVKRTTLKSGEWVTKTQRYPSQPRVEDPLAALYRIRAAMLEAGKSVSFPIFTGRSTVTLKAVAGTKKTTIAGYPSLQVDVYASHEGDVKGNFTVYMSTDENRVPVQLKLQTKMGAVTATISRRSVGK